MQQDKFVRLDDFCPVVHDLLQNLALVVFSQHSKFVELAVTDQVHQFVGAVFTILGNQIQECCRSETWATLHAVAAVTDEGFVERHQSEVEVAVLVQANFTIDSYHDFSAIGVDLVQYDQVVIVGRYQHIFFRILCDVG